MASTTQQEHISLEAALELTTQTSSLNTSVHDPSLSEPITPDRLQPALPPTDEGYYAWLSLAGSFISNAVVWGFALSFGVLQEYYTSHAPFSGQAGIAAIGTTCTGLMYLGMPVFLGLFQKWPRLRQYCLWASLPIIGMSLVGASFATTVTQLLVCQGVLYAVAGNALVMPSIAYLNEWFVRRKGLAIGVAIAGDGVGGVAMPLVLQAMLSGLGWRWTLRVAAIMIVILAAPLPFVLKPRLPVSASATARPVDLSFLQTRLFWILQTFNIAQALGYILPSNYLPSIAESIGLSSTLGSLTVLFVNVGLSIGSISVGALCDRFEVTAVILGVSIGAAITIFAILGFTTSIVPLYIFSLMYGLTAGAYSTNWGGMIKDIQKQHEGTDANIVFGLLAAGRGIGSIISGPLSEGLLKPHREWSNTADSTYGSEYGPLIVFSGCTALAGGLSWFVRKAGLI